MSQVSFIIDGFNLYHSAKEASRDMGGAVTKWLDIRSLAESYLHLFGRDARAHQLFYFSALATHLEARKPDVTKRHRAYLECLEATGIIVKLNRFKPNPLRCRSCGQTFKRYEEKETDVAIAAKLLELFARDVCDTAVLVTGDTDLAPAVRTASDLYPAKKIVFAFPYRRKNRELQQLAPGSFRISKEQYTSHQFADPYLLPSGRLVAKPATW